MMQTTFASSTCEDVRRPGEDICSGAEEGRTLDSFDASHLAQPCMADLWWVHSLVILVYVSSMACCNESLWCFALVLLP